MTNKIIYGGVVIGAILGAIAFAGYSPFIKTVIQQFGSPTNTTFNSAKVAAINMAPISRTSTSTSIYNGDASDRIVLDAYVTCSGVTTVYGSGAQSTGVDAWHWYAATSSSAAPTATIANATLAAMNVTVATSSSEAFTATSTYTSPYSRRWNAGTYMIFQTNATSSAAVCQPGVHYISL